MRLDLGRLSLAGVRSDKQSPGTALNAPAPDKGGIAVTLAAVLERIPDHKAEANAERQQILHSPDLRPEN